jgi:hypothetical protein
VPKFSDSPYFILKAFIENISPHGTSYMQNGCLDGGRSGIIARGGYGVDLYVKTEEGYKRIKATPISGYPQDNIFRFYLNTTNYRASELTWNELRNYVGSEVYFRKGYLFHDYTDHQTGAESYLNTNKVHLYFGKIYTASQTGYFVIPFEGMKDYAFSALPSNNQTDNVKELFKEYFDKIHSKPYNLIKNIWTLSDPKEVNEDYLYYISNMYNMGLISDATTARQREYVSDLPNLLKRKGTYSSLYIVWKSIIERSDNYLNIYERWHIPSLPSDNPFSYFNDVLYTFYPEYNTLPPTGGAGVGYYYSDAVTGSGYPEYNLSTGEVLSTHYRVEIDLTSQPLGTDFIINETLWNSLIEMWEIMRPVCRVAHYSEVIAPLGDFRTVPTSLYGTSFAAYMNTRCCKEVLIGSAVEPGTAILLKYSSSDFWIFEHGLNRPDVIIQCYDENYNMVEPISVEYLTMNSVKILWARAQAGYGFACTPDYTLTVPSSAADTSWTVPHTLGEIATLFQVDDETYKKIIPLGYAASEGNSAVVTFAQEEDGYSLAGLGEYVYTATVASDTWRIPHNLNATAVMIQVYQDGLEVIDAVYPKNINIDDAYTAYIQFAYPITGKAVVKKIAKYGESIDGLFDSVTYVKFGNGVDPNTWDARYENDIKNEIGRTYDIEKVSTDDYFYINSSINFTTEGINITEIGIFDENDDILWYTYNSDLFKPKDGILKVHTRILKRA